MSDHYASEEETMALIKPDTRTPAERELDRIIEENGGNEQGAEPEIIIRRIALALIEDTMRLDWIQAEIRKSGVVSFERHGQAWTRMFSVTSQWTPNMEKLRDVVDHAMKEQA